MHITQKRVFQALGFLLFSTGIVMLVTSFWLTPKTPIQVYTSEIVASPAVRPLVPSHIQIGNFIDLPIEMMQFDPQKGWLVSDTAASIASSSAFPGEKGNIVIYSHNLTRLFGKLSQAKVGDAVTLTTTDGKPHLYTVSARLVVTPSQIEFLKSTDTEVLTLYTCSGLFDRNRLVVQALPNSSIR